MTPFKDKLPGLERGAEKHYDLLSIDQIKNLEFEGGAALRDGSVADDAYLFLWRVSAGGSIEELTLAEQAYAAARAWDFAPKTEHVWRKQTVNGKRHFGMGWHLRNEHETCIVAVRGNPKPLVRNIRSVLEAPAPSGVNGRAIHSAKPDAFYTEVAEKISRGPYLELFARSLRPGWTCYGNQLPR
jgi:N6-adenosine-specific RNA methylase IME4